MSITRSNAGLRLGAAFACLATAGTIWAVCATQPATVADDAAEPAAEASEPTKRYDSQADQSVFDNPATLEEYTANRTQRDADAATIYAAEVTTLEDGTQVQPVPNDARYYNVGIQHAEDRGCTSCHSLEDALEWCPISHNALGSYGEDPLSVTTCIACHDGQQEALFNRPGLELSTVIHGSHMNSAMFQEQGGNCLSCHHTLIESVGGTNQLWLGSTPGNYFARDVVSIRLETRAEAPADPTSDEARATYENLPNIGVKFGGEVA